MIFKRIIMRAGILAAAAIITAGCTIKYSFSGASIPPQAKTFTVAYFPNNAQYVAPILSSTMTDGLIERMERQTRLSQTREGGDLSFEGEITGWNDAPSMISANDTGLGAGATMNRLTITVKVRFTSSIDPQQNYDKSFSAYSDYPSSSSIMTEEANLIPVIVEDLVNQIFNAAVANW